MLSAPHLIGIALILLCMIATTLHLSLRDVSFAKLSKALAKRRRSRWLEIYREMSDEFILSVATVRMASTLGLVIVVFDVLSDAGKSITLFYVEVFIVSAVLISVFGVAIPQPLAKYAGEALLARSLLIIQAVHFVMKPITFTLGLFDGLIRRLAGVPKYEGEAETEQLEQEMLDAVNEAEMLGAVDKTERAMIESVMELDETTVGQVMTPRTDLISVRKETTLQDLKALILKEGHSRLPVYDGNIDQVLGMVYAKDLLHVPTGDAFDLTEHLRQVPFVPETKPLRDLLQEFQTGKPHAAIVLDEYGGTAGLVTIEDILEELVGEITDEYEPPEPEPITRIDDRTIEVDSKVHVDDINELLELNLPEGEDYETIGGLVFSKLGAIPPAGKELTHANCKITILEAEDRRIKRLRIEALDPRDADS